MQSQTGCMRVPTSVTLLSFNTARLHQPVLKGEVFILLNPFLLRTLEPSCVTLQQGLLMVDSCETCSHTCCHSPNSAERSLLEWSFKGTQCRYKLSLCCAWGEKKLKRMPKCRLVSQTWTSGKMGAPVRVVVCSNIKR